MQKIRKTCVAPFIRQCSGNIDQKSQSVLKVVHLREADDLIPVHIRKCEQDPRKSLDSSGFSLGSIQGREQDIGRILSTGNFTPKISKACVAEICKVGSEFGIFNVRHFA